MSQNIHNKAMQSDSAVDGGVEAVECLFFKKNSLFMVSNAPCVRIVSVLKVLMIEFRDWFF
jgi:hypothetical protein